MKTKEFDEAIHHYNKSIELDPEEPTTYCNRALAFIKRKQFQKGLEDCDKSIALKNDYSKAYYRRAVCSMGLNNFVESLNDLLYVLAGAPSSPEVVEELKNLKEKWSAIVNKEQWNKIEEDIDSKVAQAKDPKKRDEILKILKKAETERGKNSEKSFDNKQSSTHTKQNSSFKKIKIVEEVIEDINTITPELSML